MASTAVRPYGGPFEGYNDTEPPSPPDPDDYYGHGSPSKSRRTKRWYNGSPGQPYVERDNVAGRGWNRCRVCCAVFLILLAILIAVGGALIVTKKIDVTHIFGTIFGTSAANSPMNYTSCVEGWTTELFAVVTREETCSSLKNESSCAPTINCCWSSNGCTTYRNQPDCHILTTMIDCERNSFCAWRLPEQVCRRADRTREQDALARFDKCSALWDVSRSIADFSCESFSNDRFHCSKQVGCCWINSACTEAPGLVPCDQRKSRIECNRVLPERSAVCVWSGSKCYRQGQLSTRSPTPPTTQSPTLKPTKTPTERPSKLPTEAPTTKSPTLKPTTKTPTRNPTTLSPTMVLNQTPTSSVSSPTVSQRIPGRKRKTSFLIMLADDLGWSDVSYIAGGQSLIQTPKIDEMARGENTVNMMRFHSSSVTCSPTRAALLSGRHPIRDCVWGANARWDAPKVAFKAEFPFQGNVDQSLGKLAKSQGWKTAFLGKFHIDATSSLTRWGFDSWIASPGNMPTFDSTCFCGPTPGLCFRGHYTKPKKLSPNYGCDLFASTNTHQEIRNQSSAMYFVGQLEQFLDGLDEEDQFLAVLAFHEPHVPFIGPPWRTEALLNGLLKNVPQRNLIVDYVAAIAEMDEAVGRARAALRRLQRNDDTLVIFSSDNGPENPAQGGWRSPNTLRGGKRSLFEGGHRVPALVEWPQAIRGNIVTQSLIQTTDLTATMMEIILQDDMAQFQAMILDGESLLDPLLSGSIETFQRQKPLLICATTPGKQRRPCPQLAVMHPQKPLKVLVNVRKNGLVKKNSVRLFAYEVTEHQTVKAKFYRSEYNELITASANFGSGIIAPSKKKCRFPAVK